MDTGTQPSLIEKCQPVSQGRTDLRKRKPKQLAIINESCTGCSGSPACVEYCPVEACMFWVPDGDSPFGRIEVDKSLCIGCARCTSKGPDGAFLDGCPWNAIEMVDTSAWESQRGIALPDKPDRPTDQWMSVADQFI